ncbi:MAG: hypothetical protein HOV68_13675, partial [Streptomycetaceae bacterium]|nr:hypothetical protein [Streptomycetaceae bacterium]
RLDLIGPGVATALPASGALTEAGKLTGQLPIPAAGSRTLTLTKLTVALAAKSGEAVGLVCVPSSPAGPALTVKAEAKQASSASATPSPGTTVLQQNVGAGLGATGTTAPGTTTPATTPGSGTTGAGTNGNASGGNLAATGSKDSGITAFAMLAGTALLGALAVLLTTPARRRRAAHQAAHHSSERS